MKNFLMKLIYLQSQMYPCSFASFDLKARYQGLHVHQFQFLHH